MGNGGARTRATSSSRALGAARLAGVATLAAGFAHAVPSVSVLAAIAGRARVPRLGPIALRGRSDRGVALTFDDGPSPTTTPRVLVLLDKLGLRATFFVTGSEVEAHPGLIEDIRAAGHDVETHGMEHKHHLLRGPAWVLADTARAVEGLRAVGVTPRYLRPPYGQVSAGTLLAARRSGLVPVLWSAWGREFADRSAEAVAGRVTRGLVPGSIILFHDSDRLCGEGSVAAVEGALPLVAEELTRRQLQVATVAEVLA
jgi:peptidoglycan-N-acetylglucosamine deacetylase